MPEDLSDEPDDIAYLDRGAFIVRPTWKFVEWVQSLEDPLEDDSQIQHHSVYLMEGTDFSKAEDTVDWLEPYFLDIAANEFAAWWTKEDDWPRIPSLAAFFQYFECVPSETVVDLAADLPIYDERDFDEDDDDDDEEFDDGDFDDGDDEDDDASGEADAEEGFGKS